MSIMLICTTRGYIIMSICCFVQRIDTMVCPIMLICTTRGYNGLSICCFVERVDIMVCPYVVL